MIHNNSVWKIFVKIKSESDLNYAVLYWLMTSQDNKQSDIIEAVFAEQTDWTLWEIEVVLWPCSTDPLYGY